MAQASCHDLLPLLREPVIRPSPLLDPAHIRRRRTLVAIEVAALDTVLRRGIAILLEEDGGNEGITMNYL